MEGESRFLGSLLGLAVGDALGLVCENLSRRTIARRFGQIDDFGLFPGRAYVSDDTEQALALAASLLECGRFDAVDFARRLRRWFWTFPPFIGLATVRACLKLTCGCGPQRSGVNSAGNGSSMRVAPLGLFFATHPEELVRCTERSARITHTHPRAIAGTVVVGLAVADLVRADSAPDPVAFVGRLGKAAACYDSEMAAAVTGIPSLLPCRDALERIGTSGYVLHTVPAALYCFLRTPNSFRETVMTAANAGGDTDTIAAIAGSLSGAYNGVEKIPAEWLRALERAPGLGRESYIRAVALALHRAATTGRSQPPVPVSHVGILRSRVEFLALLIVQVLVRTGWFLFPRRKP